MKKSLINKNKQKIIKVMFQSIILLSLLYIIITALFSFTEYKPFNPNEVSDNSDETGFIAISYFGADRKGDETLIGVDNLEKHLKALKDSGYVTITQQDIVDYYQNNKALPKKSLFLIFEDGRKDSAIFAQKIMEKQNFKATVLGYANELGKQNQKFLKAKDLKELVKSTFWELGTNGYRLEFINVSDRHGNYLGELNPIEFSKVSAYVDRNYNHYLMDYIRDEYDIPKESLSQMQNRIKNDYLLMREVYEKEVGYLPPLYVLMHSNTGKFGTHRYASDANQKGITENFKINFNRSGFSLNNSHNSIYDLTRIQPQSYWSVNHLLMRIKDDTNNEVQFIVGDEEKAAKWEKIYGEAEFFEESIILTTNSKNSGLLKLKDSSEFSDIKISVNLDGNKFGGQSIYLRANEKLENYTLVKIKNNVLYIINKASDDKNEKIIYELDLDVHDGLVHQTMLENKEEAEKAEVKAEILDETSDYSESNDDGDLYIPSIELKEKGKRYIEISMEDDKLNVSIDNKEAASDVIIENALEKGYVYIQSEWGGEAYSQRNISDDVYDGVFSKLLITELNSEKSILYDARLTGFEKIVYNIKNAWLSIIDWFIKVF